MMCSTNQQPNVLVECLSNVITFEYKMNEGYLELLLLFFTLAMAAKTTTEQNSIVLTI